MNLKPKTDGLPGVIYARISSLYGERADSLDNQSDRSGLVAAKMEVPVLPDYIFKERDSGHETIDTRVDLLKVRRLAREGKISHVFIHAWDRLSRTPEELVSVWKEFNSYGVQVVCIQSPVHDLDISLAKMILRMQGMVGEMEWEYIRRRTTENKQNIRDRGKRVGEGGPLFGYKWLRRDDGKIHETRAWVIDEPAAKTIRVIFDLIGNQGLSLRQVMEYLNERPEEHPTPSVYRGNKFKDGRAPRWSYNLRKLVIDVTYKGVATCSRKERVSKRYYKERPVEDWKVLDNAPTPVIVDADLWQRANDAMRAQFNGFEMARNFATTRNKEDFAFFRGILRCSSCGGYMRVHRVRQWDKKAKAYTGAYKLAYKCDTRWDKLLPAEQRVCDSRAVYESKVAEACWEAALAVITTTGWIEDRARALKSNRPGEDMLRDSLQAARSDLAKTEKRIKNVINQMADEDDKDNLADLKLKVAELREEKKGWEARIRSLAEKVAGYDLLDRRCDELVRDVASIRAGLSDPSRLTWPERRKVLDGIHARFTGSGETMQLEVDLGLEDVSVAEGPFAVGDIATRSSMRRDRYLFLAFSVTELLDPAMV